MFNMTQFIYLHGFASGPNSKKAFFFKHKLASLGLTLEIIDLNCPSFTHLTLTESLSHVESLIDNSRDTILIGSSLGGLMSLILAERNHQAIAKLILLAPALEINRLWTGILDDTQLNQWHQDGKLAVFHSGYNEYVELHYEFLLDLQKHEDMVFTRKIPTIIFHGIHDEIIPLEVSERYSTVNDSATLIKLDSDHSLENSLERIWQETTYFLRNI